MIGAEGILALGAALPFLMMLVAGRMPFLIDLLHQSLAGQSALDQVLRAMPSRPPLWNPFAFCGSPLIGDPQMQVLYPPALLFRFLNFDVALDLCLAVHAAIAVTGSAAWLRRCGFSGPSMALGAISFGMNTSGFMLANNLNCTAARAWIPWIAWGACRGGSARGAGRAVPLGIVWSMLWLAGVPAYGVVAVAIAGICAIPARSASWFGSFRIMTGSSLVSVLVPAVLLIPALSYIGFETSRGTALPEGMRRIDEAGLSDLGAYLSPFLHRSPRLGSLAFVRPHFMTLHFGGTFTIVCTVVGLLSIRSFHRVRVPVLLAVSGVALGFGENLPVLGRWAWSTFPLSYTRHAAMWLVGMDLAVAWFAAAGLVRLLACVRHPVMLRLAVLPVVLTALELGWIGWMALPTAPSSAILSEPTESGVLRKLNPAGPLASARVICWPLSPWPGRRTEPVIFGRDRTELAANFRATLIPNLPVLSGIRQMDGDNPLVPGKMEACLSRLAAAGPGMSMKTIAILRSHDVSWILTPARLAVLGQSVYSGRVTLYRLDAAATPTDRPPYPSRVGSGLESEGPGSWEMNPTADERGLVIRECALHGWRADAPTRRLRLHEVDEGFAVVGSSRGETVRIRYDPTEFKVGLWVSALVLGAILIPGI